MNSFAEDLKRDFEADLAAVDGPDAWKAVRDRWLARESGIVQRGMKRLRELPREERPAFGQAINLLREHVERLLEESRQKIRSAGEGALRHAQDTTRPGFPYAVGSRHPIRRLQSQIEAIFVGMGFRVFDVPEVESEHYNFEALNMPRSHPAREAQDTFYFLEDTLLRSHCSTVQPHSMEAMKPPIRAVHTGKVYRRDPFDATHSPMFFQVDVLVVDKGITMGDLKGCLEIFLRALFGEGTFMRLRPGFFPFVEPGAEVDIRCIFCAGTGCRICKQSGWIEILGAGMVHPKVLAMGGVDGSVYSGFAWGMGIDRVAILKYGVDDIRLFFENDLRFLSQF